MQKDSKFLDDLARLGSSAVSSALDIRREIEASVSAQLEKILLKMNLVTKEEHEVTRAMAVKAREENEELRKRLAELEKQVNEFASK